MNGPDVLNNSMYIATFRLLRETIRTFLSIIDQFGHVVYSMYSSLQVLILSIESASCYWVRILEHRPTDAHQTGSCSHTVDNTEFLELTMSTSGWFADPSHRVKHELVSVGDLCAVKAGNTFQRYLTTKGLLGRSSALSAQACP